LGEEAYSAAIQISLDCVWRMSATGARQEVEQSRNYANLSGPQSAMQIVLRGACPGESVVEWLLERVDNPA
jgi:uncharacterized heparinase superfamily protein